jgi:PKD repeat protein
MLRQDNLRYGLLLLCSFIAFSAQGQLNISFSSSGNFCSGGLISFQSTVTGGNPPYQYEWNFGGQGTSTIDHPSFAFTAAGGCGMETLNVSLKVTDQSNETTTVSIPVSFWQLPNLTFTDTKNEFDPFSNCISSSRTFSIGLALASAPPACIQSYIIDWGDGSPVLSVPAIPVASGDNGIAYTYATQGIYTLTITVITDNGCTIVREYEVRNMTNGKGGIDIPDYIIGLCAPADVLEFSITPAWFENHPSTSYTIDYGDGTTVSLTQAAMLLQQPLGGYYLVPYIYTEPSCPNEYIIRLTISNVCGDVSLATGTRVAIKPFSSFIGPGQACVNTLVTFTNTADGGYTPNCNRTANYFWIFGDGTSATYMNAPSPPPGTHTYTSPGTYIVTLIVANACGRDTTSTIICIEPRSSLSFDLGGNTTGCAPLTVSPINTSSYTSTCSTESYRWLVRYNAGSCGTGSAYTYLNGSDDTTKHPTIQFLNPGNYSLELTTRNSVCTDTSATQIITVHDRPTVSIQGIPSTDCQRFPSNTYSPIAVVLDCDGSSTYSWSFPGGVPTASSAASPTVEYVDPGTYTINLTVENTCGSTASSATIIIAPTPVIAPLPDQVVCNGDFVPSTSYTPTVPGTISYNWTNSNPAINLAAGGTGFIPAFTAANTSTAPISSTVTVTPSIGSCTGASVSYTVTVNPALFGTLSVDKNIVCVGANVTLTFNCSNGVAPYTFFYTVNGGAEQSIVTSVNSATITVPTGTVNTFAYNLVRINDSNQFAMCPSQQSGSITVQVAPIPVITTHPSDQQICTGLVVNTLNVTFAGGAGTPTYQWYKNTINSNIGGTPIAGATAAGYLPPSSDFTAVGRYYYYVIISFGYDGCGTLISNTAEIEVVSMPPVSIAPETQSICQNTTATSLEVVTIEANCTYQWYDNNGIISGATGTSYNPPTNTAGTFSYYYKVMQLYPVCEATSDTAKVIVVPMPAFTHQPPSYDLCEGEQAPVLTIAYEDGVGTPEIQWYENSTNSYSGTPISDATSTDYTPPVTQSGSTYYYCVVNFPLGNCGSITSNIVYVTVHPTPVVNEL